MNVLIVLHNAKVNYKLIDKVVAIDVVVTTTSPKYMLDYVVVTYRIKDIVDGNELTYMYISENEFQHYIKLKYGTTSLTEGSNSSRFKDNG